MPFDLDRQDLGRAPGALDAMRQLVRLTTVAEQLGSSELAVLVLVAERLLEGRQRYGVLDPATDPRDFRREAFEELADAAVYLGAAVSWLVQCPHCQCGFRNVAERDAHARHCEFRRLPHTNRMRIFRRRRFENEDDKGAARV